MMKFKIISLFLACLMLCSGCAQEPVETTSSSAALPSEAPTEVSEETEPPETESDIAEEKEFVIYFANWYLDTKTAEEGAEVCAIPWEQVTCINHAFWEIQPADGTEETSFQRRDSGAAPRTSFKIVSTLPEADFDNQEPSTMAEGLPRNHFAQYAAYSEKYPDVKILISIGGWTRCGYFSEMAFTPQGRTSFVTSCMELLEAYPWIDGIDIDWEYFGGSKDGERRPEDDNDQGCPIWGTVEQDSENFAALAKELRETMDAKYGAGVKKLTGCVSASTGWTLPMQNWRLVAPYMDMLNIMSYDMAGVWDHVTGHASRGQHAKDAVTVMHLGHAVPHRKMCIGTPMFGTDLKMIQPPKNGMAVGASIESKPPCSEEITQTMLRQWESEAVSGYTTVWEDGRPVLGEFYDNGGTGWHMGYDKFTKASYIYNDDETSEYYLWYISYETPLTLQDKLDLVDQLGIAGIMMWEISEDTYDHQMSKQISDWLFRES